MVSQLDAVDANSLTMISRSKQCPVRSPTLSLAITSIALKSSSGFSVPCHTRAVALSRCRAVALSRCRAVALSVPSVRRELAKTESKLESAEVESPRSVARFGSVSCFGMVSGTALAGTKSPRGRFPRNVRKRFFLRDDAPLTRALFLPRRSSVRHRPWEPPWDIHGEPGRRSTCATDARRFDRRPSVRYPVQKVARGGIFRGRGISRSPPEGCVSGPSGVPSGSSGTAGDARLVRRRTRTRVRGTTRSDRFGNEREGEIGGRPSSRGSAVGRLDASRTPPRNRGAAAFAARARRKQPVGRRGDMPSIVADQRTPHGKKEMNWTI